ncbi:MAG: hypothetical protein CO029_01760 [Candidatus Magasanikbacteria bacterium CG_4_9_14_0_2_um_filter_41_10]|nr:MAG: hypothetical protein AUJ37_04340 [Candidatus Magasanikbacteria bacterium CG1_02_41_34]PJC53630.1 MAG: hypothetical protein CO029_01760 [Candidatus Magasanikbacteria bacterium CG_4_9_14_0_2_um_filter_41_10]
MLRKKSRKKKKKHQKKYIRRSVLMSPPFRWKLALIGISTSFVVVGIFFIIQRPEAAELPYDVRPERIDRYFAKNNMPLKGHGKTFVEAADTCGMDWRLLPAIAVRESSGGKHMQLNNPFGWGGAQIPFESIDDATRVVGQHLCGDEPDTAKWYSTTSTYEKLYRYNGTVISTYPAEVQWIMNQF